MSHPKDLETLLSQSLDDRRLSRAERQVLGHLLSSQTPSSANAARIQHRALQLAKSALSKSGDNDILVWFHDVSKVINQWRYEQQETSIAHTDFSPSNEPRARIIGLINDARETVDCCVFTITDDRITDALRCAHKRGVQVRIISDDRKSEDLGSDVDSLERVGIPVRLDRTAAHMHHKFLIVDNALLLTGSYNWTKSAAQSNHENVLVTNDARFVCSFIETFEALWTSFS